MTSSLTQRPTSMPSYANLNITITLAENSAEPFGRFSAKRPTPLEEASSFFLHIYLLSYLIGNGWISQWSPAAAAAEEEEETCRSTVASCTVVSCADCMVMFSRQFSCHPLFRFYTSTYLHNHSEEYCADCDSVTSEESGEPLTDGMAN